RVDEKGWNAQFPRPPKKVWPNLGFDEDNGLRVNRRNSAEHVFTAIDRVIDLLDVRRKLPIQFAHAGGSRGRDDDLQIRQARFERADQLRADVDFADADGMNPEDVPIGDRLLDLRAEAAKALAEPFAPLAATKQFQEVIRRSEPEKEREA